MTCVLHLINQTPIEWYCKKQATEVTATYYNRILSNA